MQGAYVETYTAQPRSVWVFSRWENYCTTSVANVCSFAVPTDVVQKSWCSTMPALVAVFSPETGGNMDVIECKKVGTETLYGFLTDKYQVTIKNPDGSGQGFFWLTRVGILLQMEMTITADDGK